LGFDFTLSGLELLGIISVGHRPTLMIQGFLPFSKNNTKKIYTEILQLFQSIEIK
jgi:hypothetical protein